MTGNSDAVYQALRGGLRAVNRTIPDMGSEILSQFRDVVGNEYPPASAPGAPPHSRTGAYQAGLSMKTEGTTIVISAEGGENNKAIWLEFGTRKMAARPHWRTRLPEIVAKVMAQRVGTALVRGEIT